MEWRDWPETTSNSKAHAEGPAWVLSEALGEIHEAKVNGVVGVGAGAERWTRSSDLKVGTTACSALIEEGFQT